MLVLTCLHPLKGLLCIWWPACLAEKADAGTMFAARSFSYLGSLFPAVSELRFVFFAAPLESQSFDLLQWFYPMTRKALACLVSFLALVISELFVSHRLWQTLSYRIKLFTVPFPGLHLFSCRHSR